MRVRDLKTLNSALKCFIMVIYLLMRINLVYNDVALASLIFRTASEYYWSLSRDLESFVKNPCAYVNLSVLV